jgi:hypothetical protein
MFIVGPIHGIEYKTVKYQDAIACSLAQNKVKLGDSWNAQCMTEEQFYSFRQQQ